MEVPRCTKHSVLRRSSEKCPIWGLVPNVELPMTGGCSTVLTTSGIQFLVSIEDKEAQNDLSVLSEFKRLKVGVS